MITDNHPLFDRPHQLGEGRQRIYSFNNGYGLSVVNSKMLHSYRFAWEIAVLNGLDVEGNFKNLDYSTNLTDDVVVCMTDDEANAFIEPAARTLC